MGTNGQVLGAMSRNLFQIDLNEIVTCKMCNDKNQRRGGLKTSFFKRIFQVFKNFSRNERRIL